MIETSERTANKGTFALVTAAYNEERCIEETIKSVVAQNLRPDIWVIVSDASTDRTDEIAQRYAAEHAFIRFVRRNKDHNKGYSSKVFALRAGVEALGSETFEFLGHLDADISLDRTYFSDLLQKFKEDPSLGIGGGWYTEADESGEFKVAPGNIAVSVPGALQMFRWQCYQDVGGLLPIEYGGEDWYAEVMARKCGWTVKSFSEITARHLRKLGTARSALRYCYYQGFTDYAFGSHPVFELVKVAKRLTWRPFFLGAMSRLLGFGVAHFVTKRMVPPDFVAFLRKEQLARLQSRSTPATRNLERA
jgi:biofilm PGA synthesis N-glycosyltransferase PgaC